MWCPYERITLQKWQLKCSWISHDDYACRIIDLENDIRMFSYMITGFV